MTSRRVPGAVLLGLLASLVAHTAAFGDGHRAGGTLHDALFGTAVAAAAGLVVAFGALAWFGAGSRVEGSVLASRLTARLPGSASVALAAALWLAAIESAESAHAGVPTIFLAFALAAGVALVQGLARAVVRLLAGIAVAIARTPFAARGPLWNRRAYVTVNATSTAHAGRRFARPPPR